MEKRDVYNEEESIRKLIGTTKKKAPENLKYRIMRQIESEKALTPQKAPQEGETQKEPEDVLKDLGTIFGTMYAVLAIMTIVVYFLQGKEFLFSSQFLEAVIFVASVFSLFWLISRVDAYLEKRRNRKLTADKTGNTTGRRSGGITGRSAE